MKDDCEGDFKEKSAAPCEAVGDKMPDRGWHSIEFVNDLQSRIKSLESELAQLREENDALEKDIQMYRNGHEVNAKRYAELLQENKRLQSELLLRDITMLPEKDREIDELKSEIDNWKQRYGELFKTIGDPD